jgi:hypothetical protein
MEAERKAPADVEAAAKRAAGSSLSSVKCQCTRASWGEYDDAFYFHLTSKQDNIPDDSGKELDPLIDAYEHARVLIDKILFHVGYEDADLWKVVISNDEDDAQMIVPFAVSHAVRGQRRGIT